MALQFSPNLINHHKPYSPINPNSKSNAFRFSIQSNPSTTSTVLQRERHRLLAVNGEDSAESSSQDDEVNSLGVKAALSMLRFYKREISPLMPNSCRYVPTCSEYSMIAYKKYGVAKGTVLTAWRLCRCNPLGGSGFDPPRWFDETTPTEK